MKKTITFLLILFSFSIASEDKELLVFFDTPELLLLENDAYILYSKREYISKKGKLKYLEEIKLRYKKIDKIFQVKHYKNSKTIEGKHSLISLVKRKEREEFIVVLKSFKIKKPMRMKQVFSVFKTINDKKENNYIKYYKKLDSEVYFLSLRLKYPELIKFIYILFLGSISLFILWLFFGKRLK